MPFTEKVQQRKNPPIKIISEDFWSEWGDSNSRHLAPKASALPTALHPDMKFSNCGQTCGQRRFLTSYRRGGKCCQPNSPKAFQVFRGLRPGPGLHAPKAGALPTAQHPDMKLWNCPGGFSQSKRATNCATHRYLTFACFTVAFNNVISIFHYRRYFVGLQVFK